MKRFVPLLAVLLLSAAPAAQAATPARVTGKLTGAKLPRAGQGRVVVWAVHLPDGVVTAGATASSSGRFTLKMRAGDYAILAAVVPRKGRGNPIVRVADFVTAKAGKRRTIKPTLKKRHKKRRRAKRGGRRAPVRLGGRRLPGRVGPPLVGQRPARAQRDGEGTAGHVHHRSVRVDRHPGVRGRDQRR